MRAHAGIEGIARGIVPRAAPFRAGSSPCRFEGSVRPASVAGQVGAGGSGHPLRRTIRACGFRQACAILPIAAAVPPQAGMLYKGCSRMAALLAVVTMAAWFLLGWQRGAGP